MTFSKVDHNHEFSWPDYNKARDAIAKHERRERRLKRAARVFWRAVFLIGALDMALLSFGCSRSEDAQLLVDTSSSAAERPNPGLDDGMWLEQISEGSPTACISYNVADREAIPFCQSGQNNIEITHASTSIPRTATIDSVRAWVFNPFRLGNGMDVPIGQPWDKGWVYPSPSNLYASEWLVNDWPSKLPAWWDGKFCLFTKTWHTCADGSRWILHDPGPANEVFEIEDQCDTGCPTTITRISETWGRYCVNGVKKARCTVVFQLDGEALPDGAADLGGGITIHNQSLCGPYQEAQYFQFTQINDSTWVGVAEGFTFDIVTSAPPEYHAIVNFWRSGFIYVDCDGIPARYDFVCAEEFEPGIGFVSLPNISCGGGGGGGFEEQGKQSPHRMACPAFDGEGACCCDLGGVLPEEWAAYWLGNFGYRQP